MLEIKLQEFEQNSPSKGNYYYLEVFIQDSKYGGWTKCVFAENTWDNFINELEDFLKLDREKVNAFAGWGDEKYFDVTFSFKDKAGHVFVSLEVAYPIKGHINSKTEITHICSLTFETDLISVEKFANELRSLKRLGVARLN
jgi:hypothetical protein